MSIYGALQVTATIIPIPILVASALIILISNRIGWWIDKQPGETTVRCELDMTLAGVFVAVMAYLTLVWFQ
jgi:hypothetical protein